MTVISDGSSVAFVMFMRVLFICLIIIIIQKVSEGQHERFRVPPLALADPPPPHSLRITGLAEHNRWLSPFSSPQSRPGQVLCYLPERGREEGWEGGGGSGLMSNFTPHGLRISEFQELTDRRVEGRRRLPIP